MPSPGGLLFAGTLSNSADWRLRAAAQQLSKGDLTARAGGRMKGAAMKSQT